MKKNKLGKTKIELSELGYGCASLFGKDFMGKQGISEEKALEIVQLAINAGINFFDTGFNYGYAEERLGRCIAVAMESGIPRSKIVIETKCGETLNEDGTYGPLDWNTEWIKKSIDISLNRLKTSYIDLLAMHGGSPYSCTDQLLTLFDTYKRQGIIRAYGVNTFDDDFLEWICNEQCFDYVMLDYNILKQHREKMIEDLTTKGIGVIAGMALGQSLFSKRLLSIRNRNDVWYSLRALLQRREMLKKGHRFRFLNDIKEFSSNQLALRYVLDNKNVTSAVFSTININHLIDDISATEIEMPADVLKQIKKLA